MSETRNSRSAEQEAQEGFVASMMRLRPHVTLLEEGQPAVDALTEAILNFGTCERRLRHAERLRALSLDEEGASALARSALAQHERGLAALSGVQPLADALAQQQPDEQTLARWREESPALRAEWREQVRQLDIQPEEAQQLTRIFEQSLAPIDVGGLAGLGRSLGEVLQELDGVRRSPDRGTREGSFPVWKIVAVAGIMLLTAFAVWILLMTRAPWWNFFLVALVACVMALLIALAC